MKTIILFTTMSSIRKHWQNALDTNYQLLPIEHLDTLIRYFEKESASTIVLFDEMSVSNIEETLHKLQHYPQASILLFNALPNIYHASTLLQSGIKGYENSYLAKENLLLMIQSVEAGNRWLFSELTQFIINNYIDTSSNSEPKFTHKLTEKEKAIALMISNGLSNKEIAFNLKLSLSTVKNHITHIFDKAEVSDRISLALAFKKA